MTFAAYYHSQFTMAQNMGFCIRLVIAFIVGAMIGVERSQRFKDAGVRTHVLVCCTAALIMLISKYGFADLTLGGGMESYATRGADAARVAAQAVSGISFLCAGVIIKVGSSIKGLTTAAGIWLTAGIGLAIGAGMYVPVACTLLLLWILQHVMTLIPIGSDAHGGNHLEFTVIDDEAFNTALHKQLEDWKALVTQCKVTGKKDGTTAYEMDIRRRDDLTYEEVREFVQTQGDNILVFSTSSLNIHIH